MEQLISELHQKKEKAKQMGEYAIKRGFPLIEFAEGGGLRMMASVKACLQKKDCKKLEKYHQ